MKKLSVVALFFLIAYSGISHPIKMATLLLDLNNDTPTLTINVFRDDFEKHLTSLYRNQLMVNREDSRTRSILLDYIKKHCKVFQEKEVELQFLEYKLFEEKNILQLKFSLPDLQASKPLVFSNTILLDAFTNQTNVLHVKDLDGNTAVFQFNKSIRQLAVN